jgi:hypothetical protein
LGISETLEQYSKNTQGQRVFVYGDAGYGFEDVIMSSYRAGRGTELEADEGIFNASMSRQRIAVEWGFGKVVDLFGLIDYYKKLKIGLSAVEAWIFTAILLTNCHTCMYGSQVASYFECSPPTLWEYFGVRDEDYREAVAHV